MSVCVAPQADKIDEERSKDRASDADGASRSATASHVPPFVKCGLTN